MSFHLIEQRSQFFTLDKYNRYTFDLIKINFDKDYCAITTFVFEFTILGLGFYIYYSNPKIKCGCDGDLSSIK